MGTVCCGDRKGIPEEESSVKSQRPAASLKSIENQRKQPQFPTPEAVVKVLETIRTLDGSFQNFYRSSAVLKNTPHTSLSRCIEKASGLMYIIQEIPKTLGKTPPKDMNKLPAEAIIWKKLDHPNILRLIKLDRIRSWQFATKLNDGPRNIPPLPK